LTTVTPRISILLALGLLASMPALAGCGGEHAAKPAGTLVHVTERDFSIHAPAHVRAGTVTFVVRNDGPDAHELILARAGAPLPTRSDGLTVDEEAIEPLTFGALEPGQADAVRELRVHLTPGTYELFCNMAGHYMGGMHAVLTVS
jgi:uncharacterized cupredoxin-like copper-binding protein